ncbi:SMP-30/gluconolactonase/LRE family protein [Halococcus agarilyticus]|uniref:SMP-30/gluconolactonase/LRE family protein n=1 Tax=Halococcus agarilyticus TaxID=1232219 RepID=UPI000677E090|nr:SMP-30/gluconolactonase/LRE family protein [Halococcus agarilyticus]
MATRIADTRCETGEGPLWHPEREMLYWCDIPNGDLFGYDPETDEYDRVLDHHEAIGGYTIQADGSLLLFTDRTAVLRWEPGADGTGAGDPEPVVDPIDGEGDTRFNDVIADPAGRVFAGTMPTADRLGSLYRYDTDGSVTEVVADLDIPNGMAFDAEHESFYLTASDEHTIYRFDYDETSGDLTGRETWVETPPDEGAPDGMTMDDEGTMWSARWNASALVRYGNDGEELDRVSFPARKVSSVTFGGDEYGTAYVTTAGGDDREGEGDGAGALFAFDPAVRGRPEHRSDIPME